MRKKHAFGMVAGSQRWQLVASERYVPLQHLPLALNRLPIPI